MHADIASCVKFPENIRCQREQEMHLCPGPKNYNNVCDITFPDNALHVGNLFLCDLWKRTTMEGKDSFLKRINRSIPPPTNNVESMLTSKKLVSPGFWDSRIFFTSGDEFSSLLP